MSKSNYKQDYTDKVDDLLSEMDFEAITKLMDKISKGMEFEVLFSNTKEIKNPITFKIFEKLLKFLKFQSKKNKKMKFTNTQSVDINLSTDESMENYRLQINGLDKINNLFRKDNQWENHLIFQKILSRSLQGDESINLMKKKRLEMINLDSLGLRVRLASEDKLSEKEIKNLQLIKKVSGKNIMFRSKDRSSLIVYDDGQTKIIIDLTLTKQSYNINTINEGVEQYELEVEVISDKKPEKKARNELFDILTNLMQVIQKSKYLVNKEEVDSLLFQYSSLLNISGNRMNGLAGRNPITLEIQHVVNSVANKYAVTDKADGERAFLMIFNGQVYIISSTIRIKRTGIILDENLSKYNNTILDGEHIYLPKHKRSTFMAFDCLYMSGEDIRIQSDFMERLKYIDEIIDKCFIFNKQKNYKLKPYTTKKYDSTNLLNYYESAIEDYLKNLNHDIENEKSLLLVRKKFFIPVLGVAENEIFKYSVLLWNKYVLDPNTDCPYILDGLIYHPLQQKYTTNLKESKLFEFKWKPADKNSIDFYVTFLRDRQTNEELILFDDSDELAIKGKPYKIAHLHVGKSSNDSEYPVKFRENSKKYIAYFFLTNGEVRDTEGDIIQDKTVIECYYVNDPTFNEFHRWVPMRTRHDKTQMVKKYRRKYGNNEEVANKIWRSIINPVSLEDLKVLSADNTYDSQLNILRNRVSHDIILAERNEDVYNKYRTLLGKPKRNFHNFIESIIIYTFCGHIYNREKKLTVLDLSVGTGEVIMKYHYSRTGPCVGLNENNFEIINPTNGCLSRYKKQKNRPNFPKMNFIHATASALLDPNEQAKALGGTTDQNIKIMRNFFSLDPNKRKTYDCINCHFDINTYLSDNQKWSNFLQNVKMYLNYGGFLIAICIDGERMSELLKDNNEYESKYTDKKGNLKDFLKIRKKFHNKKDTEVYDVGHAYEIHNSLEQREDEFKTEYLVDKRFIEKQLYDNCDLEIVETDLFENLFHIYRDYFMFAIEHENNEQTKAFLMNAKEFYDQKNEVNKAAFALSRLYRFYILRKKSNTEHKKKISKVQKGGAIALIPEGYKVLNISGTNTNTFTESILLQLKNDEIIPEAETIKEFSSKLKLKVFDDRLIDGKQIKSLIKKLDIDHEIDDGVINVLKKPNILILREDCDISVDVYSTRKNINKKKPTLILIEKEGKYQPVIKKEGLFNKALLSYDDPLIFKLIDQLD